MQTLTQTLVIKAMRAEPPKIKFDILLRCLLMQFFMVSLVFLILRIVINVFSAMFA